jgi:hypothetical protein
VALRRSDMKTYNHQIRGSANLKAVGRTSASDPPFDLTTKKARQMLNWFRVFDLDW